jgi:hypothetical protein
MSKAQIITGIMEKISKVMRVAMPASIISYDHKLQNASVKINIKESYGEDKTMEYPIISNVPVMFPMGGGASLTMPVKAGDGCLLLFMDRDIGGWSLGSSEVPQNKRSHHLNDAVAIIGLNNLVTNSKAQNNEDVLLTYSGSSITLKPDGKIDIHSANEVNVKTKELIINCSNAIINSEDKVDITCKSASLKAAEDVSIECKNATIKATTKIDTETPNFLQKGNLKIQGNLEVTGTAQITGKLTTKAGIDNSGANLVSSGKVFETHTHQYQNVTTVTAPDGPCVVNKIPTNTGTP